MEGRIFPTLWCALGWKLTFKEVYFKKIKADHIAKHPVGHTCRWCNNAEIQEATDDVK